MEQGSGGASFTRLGEIVTQRVSSVSASSPCAAPIPPVLLGLAFCGRCRRILNLEPMVDPAGAIVGAEPLRHDTLTAECARMLEDDAAIADEVLIESNAIAGTVEEIGEYSLAVLKRSPPEVLAI